MHGPVNIKKKVHVCLHWKYKIMYQPYIDTQKLYCLDVLQEGLQC